MKNLALMFCLSLLVSIQGFSQKLYIKASGGYDFSTSKHQIGINDVSGGNVSKADVIFGTYGAGTVGGLGIGYMLNENIGLEAGIFYLAGKIYESEFKFSNSQEILIISKKNMLKCER